MAKLQEIILRDILANRPAAGKAGRIFYDTTNSQLQRDNGSSWDAIEGAGGATDHGALTGLGDDDHPHYATNAEFDSHASRHEAGGADEIDATGLTGAGGGGFTQSYVGTTGAAGANWGQVPVREARTKKVTLETAGLLTAIGFYGAMSADNSDTDWVGVLYEDDGGVPKAPLSASGIVQPYAASVNAGIENGRRWYEVPIGRWLAAGDYWLGWIFYRNSGAWIMHRTDGNNVGDRFFTIPAGANYIPSGHVYTNTVQTANHAIRGTIVR